MFCEKGVLKNLAKLTGKRLCRSIFLNKVAGLRHATPLKKRFRYRCFSVNFVKFFRTTFFIEHLRRMLLQHEYVSSCFCVLVRQCEKWLILVILEVRSGVLPSNYFLFLCLIYNSIKCFLIELYFFKKWLILSICKIY